VETVQVNKIPTVSISEATSSALIDRKKAELEKVKNKPDQTLKSEKEVDKAAGGFEALLLHQMLESMWSTVDFAGMFNETSNESQVYRDMMMQAVADTTAEGQGIGVKKFLRAELLKYSKASKE